MELRQMRYFVRVVELGSISRAALDLQSQGFKNVACLLGGLDAWKKAGGEMAPSS